MLLAKVVADNLLYNILYKLWAYTHIYIHISTPSTDTNIRRTLLASSK